MMAPLFLGLGLVIVAASLILRAKMKKNNAYWFPGAFGIWLIALAIFPVPEWIWLNIIVVMMLLIGVAVFMAIAYQKVHPSKFAPTAVATAAVVGLCAALALAFTVQIQPSSGTTAASPLQQFFGNLGQSQANDSATPVQPATSLEKCRARAVETFLGSRGFGSGTYTVGVANINHKYSELTATGALKFGAASTTRAGLQKYLSAHTAQSQYVVTKLQKIYPDVARSKLLDANNWEVFQSKVPMNISGNTGWENGEPVSLGTRKSAAGDAAWVYVDTAKCTVPAAKQATSNAAAVATSIGTMNLASSTSSDSVGVIRVGCSNPGTNVTPAQPSSPSPSPSTSTSKPAVCKYDHSLPANSSKCVKPPCGCTSPTPSPSTTPTMTNSPSPSPSPTESSSPSPSPTCTNGTDTQGNCKKDHDPSKWKYPGNGTKSPEPTESTPAESSPPAVNTAPPTEFPLAPGASPLPSPFRSIPTDQGGPSTSSPAPSDSSSTSSSSEPVHTAPVVQPTW